MENETRPDEVNSIAGRILALIAENISCSDEVLVAAVKVTAVTIEETKNAWFAAQLRAGVLRQYKPFK